MDNLWCFKGHHEDDEYSEQLKKSSWSGIAEDRDCKQFEVRVLNVCVFGPQSNGVVSLYFAKHKAQHHQVQKDKVPISSSKVKQIQIWPHLNPDDLFVFILYYASIVFQTHLAQFVKRFLNIQNAFEVVGSKRRRVNSISKHFFELRLSQHFYFDFVVSAVYLVHLKQVLEHLTRLQLFVCPMLDNAAFFHYNDWVAEVDEVNCVSN